MFTVQFFSEITSGIVKEVKRTHLKRLDALSVVDHHKPYIDYKCKPKLETNTQSD